jgi:hypothetical protein
MSEKRISASSSAIRVKNRRKKITRNNALSLGINTDFKLTLYADDTSVLIFGNNTHEIQAKSDIVLNSLNYWFTSNGLSLNLKKTKMLKLETTYKKHTISIKLQRLNVARSNKY